MTSQPESSATESPTSNGAPTRSPSPVQSAAADAIKSVHPPRSGAMDPFMDETFEADPTPFVERLPQQSPFPPIADYGFLSDCHTAALVAGHGRWQDPWIVS